jgi:hypothetical protein
MNAWTISLTNYFENSGLKEGRAKRIDDPTLARGGHGVMQFTAPAPISRSPRRP